MTNIDLRNEYANAKNRAFDQGCEGGFRADYTEWLEQKLASNTEIIGNVMPRELTAENGAKGLLIGEFYEEIEHDEGTFKVAVEWTTIKEIYKKIVAYYGA